MRKLLTLLFFLIVFVEAMAQVPQKISYQAVVRNSSNALIVNQTIGLRVSIIQGSILGTAVYVERQSPTTNASGVISIQIGANPLGLSFSSINWINGPFYLKTEIDPTGSNNYTISGISELLSVPYALYAQNAFTVNGLVAVINGGTGAKTPTLARVNLGLGNVDNTRDVDKPISKKVQTALNSKANLEDPVFIGLPEAPTAKIGTNTNQIANTYFVNDAIKRATPDATETVKGLIRLNGDLTGTALLPIIRDKKITTNKLADSAVTTSKIFPNNVTTESLADSSVTTIKLRNLNVTTAKLANDAVTTSKILDASITTDKLSDSSVTNAKFKDNSINTIKIADSAITTNKIRNLNITNAKLADSTVTTNKIRNLNVTTDKLADNAVTTAKILDGNITTEKLADSSVTNAKFKDNSINTIKIADSAITTNKIRNINVTTAKIADNAVTTAKIQDANVTTAKVLDSAIITTKIKSLNVTTAKLADSAVTTTKLKNLNITTAKLADNSVTTAKIQDANVTTAKVLDSAIITTKIKSLNVTTAKLADSSVTTTKIKNLNVTTAKLADSAIKTIKIADNAVTNSKILSVDQSKITGIILGAIGGTGVANIGKTITLGGNLTTTGAFATNLVSTAATNVTLPTFGTLATLAGLETFTNKTIAASSNTISGLTNANLSGSAGITDANLASITTAGKVANSATTATNTNTLNTIVSRDATGNFSAGTITANLIGNATNVTDIVAIANGGTGSNNVIGAKTNLILDQVDNTRDLNKPISNATQAALDLKAPLASPILTGIPSAPTALEGTSTTQIATTEFVMSNASTPDANTIRKGKLKLAGDLTGTADLPSVALGAIDNSKISPTAAIADTKLATISSLGKVLNSATTATNTNTINTIVLRDGTGNFSAGTITATLSGNATNVSGIVLGANGGTGIANTGKTIALDGNLTTSGAFATTLVSTAATNVTLPTTGTLATLAGIETFTNKTIAASSNTISGLTNNNLSGSAGISIANGGTGASNVIGIKTNLILDLVDNTTDLNKPISTATQDALDLKAPLASPTLTGIPIAPTAAVATSTKQIATTEFVMANASTPDATINTKGKIQLAGDLSGTADLPLVAPGAIDNSKISIDARIVDSKLETIRTDGKVANSATSATSANTINTIVARNSLGNFSAGTISANLTGNATNVTGVVLGVNGGTGIANTGKTINLGGNLSTAGAFTTSGAYPITLASIAATSVTLPITGTLATLAGAETLTGKRIAAGSNTITGLTYSNLSSTAGITGNQLADDAVTEFKIANDAVTRDKILNDAVNTLKLANDAVTELKLANDAVTELKILNDAVTESKIASIAVTETKIASDAVTQTKIASNAISGDKIQINAITESKIEDDAVTEYKILDGAITSAKIGTNAVTVNKIGSGAVTENKIGSGAVTENKIFNGAVTELKIGSDAVTQSKIKNTSVTYSKIQNVQANKILGRAPGSAGIIQELTTSGSGDVILATSPTLYNPNLGTPSAIDLSNATFIPLSKNKVKGVLSVSNGGTGADSLSGLLKGDGKNKFYSAEEGLDFSLVREVEDQTTASAGDITFYLSNQPNVNSKVKMFISGKKALRGSFTINGTTVTYIPSNNNGYVIVNNDVVEFVYYY